MDRDATTIKLERRVRKAPRQPTARPAARPGRARRQPRRRSRRDDVREFMADPGLCPHCHRALGRGDGGVGMKITLERWRRTTRAAEGKDDSRPQSSPMDSTRRGRTDLAAHQAGLFMTTARDGRNGSGGARVSLLPHARGAGMETTRLRPTGANLSMRSRTFRAGAAMYQGTLANVGGPVQKSEPPFEPEPVGRTQTDLRRADLSEADLEWDGPKLERTCETGGGPAGGPEWAKTAPLFLQRGASATMRRDLPGGVWSRDAPEALRHEKSHLKRWRRTTRAEARDDFSLRAPDGPGHGRDHGRRRIRPVAYDPLRRWLG